MDDYHAKTAHEISHLARRAGATGLRASPGVPLPGGVVLVSEPPGYAAEDRAIALSLSAVGLGPDGGGTPAYVTRASGDLLREELHALEPAVLVAVGADAARAIDDLRHPLARAAFLDAPEGAWFSWTRGTRGLRLPALAPALHDPGAKRRFWRAFLALRNLQDGSPGRS